VLKIVVGALATFGFGSTIVAANSGRVIVAFTQRFAAFQFTSGD